MGNIYIEIDENFRVTKVHRMPFDPVNGMGYTREELERKGFFIESIPEPVNQTGRRSILMYNPDIKGVYYDYVNIPMSDKERIDYLENALDAIIENLYAPRLIRTRSGDIEEVYRDNSNMIGTYLAYQIISGKMDLYKTLGDYPGLVEEIKRVLLDNGIQV